MINKREIINITMENISVFKLVGILWFSTGAIANLQGWSGDIYLIGSGLFLICNIKISNFLDIMTTLIRNRLLVG